MRRGRAIVTAVIVSYWAIACLGTETGNPGPRGCGVSCNACGTPIVLEFPNAASRSPALSSVVVDAREIACRPEGSSVRCELSETYYSMPGTYQLTVEVTGLEPIELQVEVPASAWCCACAYDGVTVQVELPQALEK